MSTVERRVMGTGIGPADGWIAQPEQVDVCRSERSGPRTGPRLLLHAESAALAAVLIVVYRMQGGGWGLFAALILAPDLFMLGYLAGPVWGARVYNAAHSYAAPAALALIGLWLGAAIPVLVATIWLAHIAADRALGYGLKYATGFSHTHLGRV